MLLLIRAITCQQDTLLAGQTFLVVFNTWEVIYVIYYVAYQRCQHDIKEILMLNLWPGHSLFLMRRGGQMI